MTEPDDTAAALAARVRFEEVKAPAESAPPDPISAAVTELRAEVQALGSLLRELRMRCDRCGATAPLVSYFLPQMIDDTPVPQGPVASWGETPLATLGSTLVGKVLCRACEACTRRAALRVLLQGSVHRSLLRTESGERMSYALLTQFLPVLSP